MLSLGPSTMSCNAVGLRGNCDKYGGSESRPKVKLQSKVPPEHYKPSIPPQAMLRHRAQAVAWHTAWCKARCRCQSNLASGEGLVQDSECLSLVREVSGPGFTCGMNLPSKFVSPKLELKKKTASSTGLQYRYDGAVVPFETPRPPKKIFYRPS